MTGSSDVMPMAAGGPVRGTVRVPGSKSHTNRSLVIAALADGASTLEGALFADDTLAMMQGLRALGFELASDDAALTVRVRGLGGRIPSREARVDARSAGTVMRFLTAVAALGEGEYVIDGSARMRERPIGDLIDGLRQLGVEVRSVEREGIPPGGGLPPAGAFPPVAVSAKGLAGGEARVSAATSSQFASAILLVSPCARSPVTLELAGDPLRGDEIVSSPFVDLTLALMSDFGAEVERLPGSQVGPRRTRACLPGSQVGPRRSRACLPGTVLRVAAPRPYRAGVHRIQGDATAASYFWAAAAVTGGRVTVSNVGTLSRQGDVAFVDVLERMGCRVARSVGSIEVSGPEAAEPLKGGVFDLNEMPDTVPTLVVVALFAGAPVEITNVANLRVKECDRLAALAAELPKLGAGVEERADGIRIVPPAAGRAGLGGARIATYDDHRVAMSFAVAGLAVPGVEIENPSCVGKTYPAFFEDLARLSGA